MRPIPYLLLSVFFIGSFAYFTAEAIPYHEFSRGTDTGNISGTASYRDGPNATQAAAGASVALISEGGIEIARTTANDTGSYIFQNVTLGHNYTVEITPPPELLGEEGSGTGYLVKTSVSFILEDPSGVSIDVELEYHVYEEPPPTHPRVRILDHEGHGLNDVEVAVVTDMGNHTAVTGIDGWAVFNDMTGITFPHGSEISARRDGYRTIEWVQGDPIPAMYPARDDDTVLVLILLLLTFSTVAILLFLGFKGRERGPK